MHEILNTKRHYTNEEYENIIPELQRTKLNNMSTSKREYYTNLYTQKAIDEALDRKVKEIN